ncbi:MAG: dihydrolipoyl dehydrogenase [Thermodesulfobacteriota bacterium]
MSQKKEYDIIVIGGGPGGYVAAIRASRLGLKTALVEKGLLGGVCLNYGCIPTKSLIRNAEVLSLVKRAGDFGINIDGVSYDYSKAVDRSRRVADRLKKGVEFLLKKGGIELIDGTGRFTSNNGIEVFNKNEKKSKEEIRGRNVIIATGSRAKEIKGLATHKNVLTSNEIIRLKNLPDRMAIIGGGAIGVEFAYILAAYDVKITIIETMEQLLPEEDAEIAGILRKNLEKKGIKVLTGALVKGVKNDRTTLEVELKDGKKEIEADSLLMAVGRESNTGNIGLEDRGIEVYNGCIKVDEWMETVIPGIYAVGDCSSPPFLAHKAMAEGILAVERIAGKTGCKPIDRSSIPRCIYTNPQVAGMGMTEKSAEKAGYKVKVGRFPFRANGKAIAIGETDGLVKIVSDAGSDEILGAQIIGPEATEILGGIIVAKGIGASSLELNKLIHPHPTLSEAVMEAAGSISDEAIHI